MITVRSPGKIMLAGEWSVLEPGNSCIVAVIDKFVQVSISESDNIIIDAPDIGLLNVVGFWDGSNFNVADQQVLDFPAKFKFCFCAIQITLKFLQEQQRSVLNFKMHISSQLSTFNELGFVKFGLGSSAAITTAVCKAILALHGYDVSSNAVKEIIFKLSCIAHYIESGKLGSGFDVAAAAFETTLIYRRFHHGFLEDIIQGGSALCDVVFSTWAGLYIEKLSLPENLKMVAVFSGVAASTTNLISKMQWFKKENGDDYARILNEINLVVLKLIKAIKEQNLDQILILIDQNHLLLQELSCVSNVEIVTPKLEAMINQVKLCGVVGKISGAGGGDCVIAACVDKSQIIEVKNFWPNSFSITT